MPSWRRHLTAYSLKAGCLPAGSAGCLRWSLLDATGCCPWFTEMYLGRQNPQNSCSSSWMIHLHTPFWSNSTDVTLFSHKTRVSHFHLFSESELNNWEWELTQSSWRLSTYCKSRAVEPFLLWEMNLHPQRSCQNEYRTPILWKNFLAQVSTSEFFLMFLKKCFCRQLEMHCSPRTSLFHFFVSTFSPAFFPPLSTSLTFCFWLIH